MDIVLGVSVTPKTVRMTLVEGARGDGAIVDHDGFDIETNGGTATSADAAAQVVDAIVGTREGAREGGHDIKAVGVAWRDRADAAELRDALADHGVDDVTLVSELHAAGALAKTAGRAVGHDRTALLLVDPDGATMSVVNTDDGSIVKVVNRSFDGADPTAVLTDLAATLVHGDAPPQGMFVVGTGVDLYALQERLQNATGLVVSAPEEAGLALARGAAIAAAHAPVFDASTSGLAYSQDPDGDTSGNGYELAGAATQLRPAGDPLAATDDDWAGAWDDAEPHDQNGKPFLLVGSALSALFIVGVVALVISLAVSIRPTADQRPEASAQSVIVPSALPPAPAAVVPPPPAPPPPAETIKAPVPVVQQQREPQAPPRTVYVEQPQAPPPQAPAPEAPPAPVPEAPAPDPVPAYVPPVPAPIILPPVWQPPAYRQPWAPWQQQPQRGDDRPNGGWPWQQGGRGDDRPDPPQQAPWQQGGGRGDDGPRGGGPFGGGPRGGGGHGGGGSNCFLIFCGPR